MVKDAATALDAALDQGITLSEVEFPNLPGGDRNYKESSDAYIDANIQLAFALAREVRERLPTHHTTARAGTGGGNRACIHKSVHV